MLNMKRVFAGALAGFVVATTMMFGQATVSADATAYTYTYDYWNNVQYSPDAYVANREITGLSLGVSDMKDPQGMFIKGDHIFICDTGNNRILEVVYKESGSELVREITDIMIDGEASPLAKPYDIFVTDDYEMAIADYGNNRIVHCDKDLNCIKVITKPDDPTYEQEQFLPQKLVIDRANRIYAQVKNINRGLMEFSDEGVFTGFVGASPVTFNMVDYIWRFFMTEKQIAQQDQFVPTEYNNVALDHDGFMYVTLSTYEDNDYRSADPVRRLNAMGSDILIRNGKYSPCGDQTWSSAGNIKGASKFTDVVTFDNDAYCCIDKTRGRIFAYDFQGNLLYAFGGVGNRLGNFNEPVAIERIGTSLFVLDAYYGSITVFDITEYGEAINNALAQYKIGEYDKSAEYWKEVLRMNGNYDLAYIGIGRALLREGQYKEAMTYFKAKRDFKNYSKAYALYRKEVVEKYAGIAVAILAVLIVVPWIIKKIIKLRKEIKECQ